MVNVDSVSLPLRFEGSETRWRRQIDSDHSFGRERKLVFG